MKEQDLIDLGFERVDVSAEESGDEAFYYYTMDFGNGSLSLISPAHNEIVDDKWYVEIFEDESIRFTEKIDLEQFINIIKKYTI
jgi:hypothetical protein